MAIVVEGEKARTVIVNHFTTHPNGLKAKPGGAVGSALFDHMKGNLKLDGTVGREFLTPCILPGKTTLTDATGHVLTIFHARQGDTVRIRVDGAGKYREIIESSLRQYLGIN